MKLLENDNKQECADNGVGTLFDEYIDPRDYVDPQTVEIIEEAMAVINTFINLLWDNGKLNED